MDDSIIEQFRKWYVNEEGKSLNSVNTLISAMRRVTLKDGGSLFQFSNYDSFKERLKKYELIEYLDRNEGNYERYFNTAFSYPPNTKLNNLKCGLKYYLRFLKESFGNDSKLPEYDPKSEATMNQDKPRNLIYFGAPGTGKSYMLNQSAKLFGENSARVTFHSDYSYAQFVGCYKPTVNDTNSITYAFIPGPFTKTLVNALKNPEEEHLLVIEEINRADAAAVFGDVFQLLDRKGDGNSEYPVNTSEDLQKYLQSALTPEGKETLSELIGSESTDCSQIVIPSNMYIWATMNSADQGVFPLDTAFKRRWSFEYVSIDNGEETVNDTWNEWRKDINKKLQDIEIEEDKFLGAHFISGDIVDKDKKRDIPTDERFQREFKNKVLMYLFEDAGKYHREEIFGDSKITLSEVFGRFDNFNGQVNILDALSSSETNTSDNTDASGETGVDPQSNSSSTD